ncbi:acetoacetate--CoA ligase [Nocardia sp. CA-120079]|uniref:acetoacetate--CoA ligase n=1 Tax=Nocardia sp. CA-120079 TaxID=3239974 RepID=UPI003D98886E
MADVGTRTDGSEAGDMLWEPDLRRRDSGLADYLEWLEINGGLRFTGYQDLWKWSTRDLEGFWRSIDSFEGVGLADVDRPVLSDAAMPGARWFPGATVNYADQIFRRAGADEDSALICVGEDAGPVHISWGELRFRVAALAQRLRSWGVEKGDRVVGYLPNGAEAVIGLIACASIGAIWSVCAPEFGTGAVISRFRQLEPKVLIASVGYRNNGRIYDRRGELAKIVGSLTELRHFVLVGTLGVEVAPEVAVPITPWRDVIAEQAELHCIPVEFDHPLWILFSSGTTGLPKGIVHGHGGIVLEHLKVLRLHTDLRQGDRFLLLGSTSWMVWNLMVSGLLVGATLVVVDGSPGYPDLNRIWEIAARHKVTALGLGAGFVQACMGADLHPGEKFDLSALRHVMVTGSPLPPAGFQWIHDKVAQVWLASCSGGTDICSAFVGGVPTLPVRVGRIQAPYLGVAVAAWDEDGAEIVGRPGELVVTKPMPSMPVEFWGDTDGRRYRESYFDAYPGVWRHGDFIEFDVDGSSQILGRSDSTLNRRGIRMGSAEIYAAVEELPEVVEALVVGAELDDRYYMPLFVKLAPGADPATAQSRIVDAIRTALSPRHVPDDIVVMPGIPHSRTGKKLEVPVKRLIQGAALADVVDPGAVDAPELLVRYQEFARRISTRLEVRAGSRSRASESER